MAAEFTITDGSAEKICSFLAGTEKGQGLVVQVLEGGCSGFEYKITIDAPPLTTMSSKTPAREFCSTRGVSFI